MKNIKDQFVSLEIAKALKERGFDDDCFAYYSSRGEVKIAGEEYINKRGSTRVLLPTYQQVVDWFRENHKFIIITRPLIFLNVKEIKFWGMIITENTLLDCKWATNDTMKYYEALDKTIEQALKLI